MHFRGRLTFLWNIENAVEDLGVVEEGVNEGGLGVSPMENVLNL